MCAAAAEVVITYIGTKATQMWLRIYVDGDLRWSPSLRRSCAHLNGYTFVFSLTSKTVFGVNASIKPKTDGAYKD